MKQRFRLYRRNCGGRFYVQNGLTGKQESLGTTDRTEALRLLNAQIARAYLLACDPAIRTRTWQTVITEIVKARHGSTKLRYERAIQEKAFENIRTMPLLQTRPEHFMKVLPEGRKSTNDSMELKAACGVTTIFGWLNTGSPASLATAASTRRKFGFGVARTRSSPR